MNTMPGFTAETALEPAIGRYRSATSALHLRSGRVDSQRTQNVNYVQPSAYIPCSWCEVLWREDIESCNYLYEDDQYRLMRCLQQARWARDQCCRTGSWPL
jgi:hypothetical protein